MKLINFFLFRHISVKGLIIFFISSAFRNYGEKSKFINFFICLELKLNRIGMPWIPFWIHLNSGIIFRLCHKRT